MSRHEKLPDEARDLLVAVNPRAGSRSRREVIEELVYELAARGLRARIFDDVEQMSEAAAKGMASGSLRAVVAAGGDGTVRLVAERIPVGAPLLVLPLGTENLLARYLEITADARQLAQIAIDGQIVRLDGGEAGGRLFTLMVGCGFDADVVRRLHGARNGHIHHLSYAKPILDSIFEYDYPELRVRYAANSGDADELTEEIVARWVFVMNLPRYAGGLSIAPDASGSDGLLDVCTFKEGSLWYGLMYLSGVLLGQHRAMQDFVHVRSRHLRIESAAQVPYQLDGDPGGELPVEIRVLPKRLTLLVAPTWAARHGLVVSRPEKM